MYKAVRKRSVTGITYGNSSFIYSYEFLDKYMKDTENIHYRDLPSQVNQQILRKLTRDWKSYFEGCKEYKKDPSKFTGKPRKPGYKDEFCTSTFTSQVSKISHADGKAWISLTGCDEKICIGPSDLYENMKYLQSEIIYKHNHFELHVTLEDKWEKPEIPKNPERIMGIDLGIDNFMSCFSNVIGMPSMLHKGKYLKSINTWYNRRRQCVTSEKTRGHKTERHSANTRRMEKISDKRENIFRDYFYKASHCLCRICQEYNIEVIVVGSNINWKQNADMGKINNQNFVSIPYDKFKKIFQHVAAQYKLPVILREESYTSKASLADKDMIPDYDPDKKTSYIFSGKRSRKAYTLNDGTIVHADINGAGNTAKKQYPNLTDNMTREQVISQMQNIKTIDIDDMYTDIKRLPKKNYIKKISDLRKEKRNTRWLKKIDYRYTFNAKRKTVKGVKGMCLSCKAVS